MKPINNIKVYFKLLKKYYIQLFLVAKYKKSFSTYFFNVRGVFIEFVDDILCWLKEDVWELVVRPVIILVARPIAAPIIIALLSKDDTQELLRKIKENVDYINKNPRGR